MWHKFIKGELYVNLKSKEEVDDFLNQCADRGLRWASGDKANEGVMKKYYGDGMLVIYDVYDSINNKRGLLISALGYTDNKQIINWSDFMRKKFIKADLNTGDVVKFRNEVIGIVNLELKMIIRKDDWTDLCTLDDNLNNMDSDWDIIAVRRPLFKHDCQFCAFKKYYGTIIYERPEPEEMTLEEVCKLLGKEIKIVKD